LTDLIDSDNFEGWYNSHSTPRINLPIRPVAFAAVLLAVSAALFAADPADEVTLDRPSEALDVTFDAVSFAFEAALEAVSVAFSVVEAYRRVVWRTTNCVGRRRRMRDDIEADMLQNLACAALNWLCCWSGDGCGFAVMRKGKSDVEGRATEPIRVRDY
jgi:hypothetical protein